MTVARKEGEYDLSHLTNEELKAVKRLVGRVGIEKNPIAKSATARIVIVYLDRISYFNLGRSRRLRMARNGRPITGSWRVVVEVPLPVDHPALVDVDGSAGYTKRKFRRRARSAAIDAIVDGKDPVAAARRALDAWTPRSRKSWIGWLLVVIGSSVSGVVFGLGFGPDGKPQPGMGATVLAGLIIGVVLLLLGFFAIMHFDNTPYTV